MSYQLNGATVRARNLAANWETADVAQVTLETIFATYSAIYLELSHFAFNEPVYLNLKALEQGFTGQQLRQTVAQWLAANGNDTLPTVEALPSPREHWAKYNDAFVAGYNVELVNIAQHHSSQLPNIDKNDVRLSRAGFDFAANWRYFLVSINGFFHRSTLGQDGLIVLEGGRTRRIMNQNVIGITSFRDVAKTTQVPITPSMVHPVKSGRPLSDGVLLSFEQNLDNKTVLLVIGGFLHVLGDSYKVIGTNSVMVDMANFNWADRYFHSREKINLESLNVETSPMSPDKTSVASLYSDDVLRAYFSLSQSFAILVDTKDVYLRYHDVENTRLPGVYVQEAPFKRLPMFGTYGSVLDYTAYREYERYVYNCLPVHKQNLMYRTTEWRNDNAINGVSYSSRPWSLADARLMEFGRYL